MVNRFVLVCFILLILTIIIAGTYEIAESVGLLKERGTFEELFLDSFQLKTFDHIELDKIKDGIEDGDLPNTKDTYNTSKLVAKFRELELEETEEGSITDIRYRIYLYNSRTYESITIYVLEDNNIWINMKTYELKMNDKTKVRMKLSKSKDGEYKVVNGDIDYRYLENLFTTLKAEAK